jgi:MOSC domain-containing protein YiiM
MQNGSVLSIHIAPVAKAPTISIDAVQAVVGRGLEGDRYFFKTGSFSASEPDPTEEVTLIEAEQVEAFNSEHGTSFKPEETRRNIVTRGISLNDLVGKEFRVGEVTLRGMELCEPCGTLARITDERVLQGLLHKAGLRAQIVEGGVIRVGDQVV